MYGDGVVRKDVIMDAYVYKRRKGDIWSATWVVGDGTLGIL